MQALEPVVEEKIAIVLRGPPCGGKSTVGCEIARRVSRSVRFVSLDDGWARNEIRFRSQGLQRYADLESDADVLIVELGYGEPEGDAFQGATRNPSEWLQVLRDTWRSTTIACLQPPLSETMRRIRQDRPAASYQYFGNAAARYEPGGVCSSAEFRQRISPEFEEIRFDTSLELPHDTAQQIIAVAVGKSPVPPVTPFDAFLGDVKRELQDVWNSILTLAHHDDVYHQVLAIMTNNPRFEPDGLIFQDWMALSYAHFVAMGIRRIADVDTRTTSLFRILAKIKGRAREFARAWFVGLYEPWQRRDADSHFTLLIGGAGNELSSSTVRKKQEQLRSALRKVSAYVDQHVAHSDASPRASAPTIVEVRKALGSAFQIHQWIRALTDATAAVSPVPSILCNWLRNFRVPWLGEREAPPTYVKLDSLMRPETDSSSDSAAQAT